MAQKVSLKIKKSTFEGGEKLMSDDLLDLGLESGTDHMKITFDNDKTVKYCLCCGCICSAMTVVFWPIYTLLFCCIRHCIITSANSRKAAVTDRQLEVQQGCVQHMFDIHEIQVKTASSTQESGPEMR